MEKSIKLSLYAEQIGIDILKELCQQKKQLENIENDLNITDTNLTKSSWILLKLKYNWYNPLYWYYWTKLHLTGEF